MCTSNGNGNETNKLLLAADQTYLSLARTMVTGTFPGPVTCETGNMLEKSLASWPQLGHPGPERLKSAKRSFLLFLLFHGFCQDGRAVAAAPDCRARLEPQPQRPVSRRHPLPRLLSPSLHPRGDAGHVPVAARRARGACRGLLARPPLLGVGGLSRGTPASLLAAASSPQFPWLAYFVLQSENLWWREASGGGWWSSRPRRSRWRSPCWPRRGLQR